MKIEETLCDYGFGPRLIIEGRSSIADLFTKGQRTGIYVLEFADGAIYAGLTVDVVRRYGQHRKSHEDIVALRFSKMPPDLLAETEIAVIFGLEAAGHRMRNISLMSVVAGERDIDLLISPKDQTDWTRGFALHDYGMRPNDPTLRYRYQSRFEKFQRLPFASDAIDLLRRYVGRMIPCPKTTELSFWCLSCLPSYNISDAILVSRISLNMMEIVSIISKDDDVRMTFHVAESPLVEDMEPLELDRMNARGMIDKDPYLYAPGGGDQLVLLGNTKAECYELMSDLAVVRAARTMNMRLMRKGPSYYSRSHCLSLADRLWS